MIYSVIWSDEAKTNYKLILEYLNTKWTQREVINFAKRTEEVVVLIQTDPYLHKPSAKGKAIRHCVLVKQISLFYRVEQNTIYLITFWDNRQNPNRLKY
jgi:plasmid stabilization system protein ParE